MPFDYLASHEIAEVKLPKTPEPPKAIDQEFEPELRRVMSLGGDTDTNGAVAGAILGTAVGRAGLPGGWLARLKERGEIEREAVGLTVLAASTA